MKAKAMGWRGHPVVVKVTSWHATGGASPGAGAMGWACSV